MLSEQNYDTEPNLPAYNSTNFPSNYNGNIRNCHSRHKVKRSSSNVDSNFSWLTSLLHLFKLDQLDWINLAGKKLWPKVVKTEKVSFINFDNSEPSDEQRFCDAAYGDLPLARLTRDILPTSTLQELVVNIAQQPLIKSGGIPTETITIGAADEVNFNQNCSTTNATSRTIEHA